MYPLLIINNMNWYSPTFFFYRFSLGLYSVPEPTDCLNYLHVHSFAALAFISFLQCIFLAQECESALKLHPTLHPILFQVLLAFWYLANIWPALNLPHVAHSLLIPGPNTEIYQCSHLQQSFHQLYTELSLASLSRLKKLHVNKKPFSFLSFTCI